MGGATSKRSIPVIARAVIRDLTEAPRREGGSNPGCDNCFASLAMEDGHTFSLSRLDFARGLTSRCPSP